jgi:hypothetical protein
VLTLNQVFVALSSSFTGSPILPPLGALRRESSEVGCPCPRLGSGEARSCPLSGPSLDLIVPIRPSQLCADGGYQLRLGVLGVPLIMVPDKTPHMIIELEDENKSRSDDLPIVCLSGFT